MKIAVIGANGQLGIDLCKTLNNCKVIPLLHKDIEVADITAVKRTLEKHKPDAIINTAAFVRVDDCETEPDKAFQVNALGARNVAVIAGVLGAKLVHISTDYVFGGEPEPKSAPYTEFDTPVPLNTYGRSMLAGENFVQHLCNRYFIVRTSALFGITGARGKGGNFVETIIKLAKEHGKLRVVNDQVCSPTYTLDLARKIAQLIDTEYYGIFHITNSGACSWHEFATAILKLARLKTPVTPVTSAEYPQKAKRPSNSVLDNYQLRLLGMADMRSWQEALQDYMTRKGHAE